MSTHLKLVLSFVVALALPAGTVFAKAPQASTHEPQKVDICHATGSAKNPYVSINVSEKAASAHDRHQHDEDVLGENNSADCEETEVTPPVGNDGITPVRPTTPKNHQPGNGGNGNGNEDHKVGICHATGSSTNPYVFIKVDKHAATAHDTHQNDEDIIGASSANDCPKPVRAVTTNPGNVGGGTLPVAQAGENSLPVTGASALGLLLASASGSLAYLIRRRLA